MLAGIILVNSNSDKLYDYTRPVDSMLVVIGLGHVIYVLVVIGLAVLS